MRSVLARQEARGLEEAGGTLLLFVRDHTRIASKTQPICKSSVSAFPSNSPFSKSMLPRAIAGCMLRHPAFLGLPEDMDPREFVVDRSS